MRKVASTGQKSTFLPQSGQIVCKLPRFPLRAGTYYLDLGADINGTKADRVLRAVTLNVIGGRFYPTGIAPTHSNDGDFLADHSWEIVT